MKSVFMVTIEPPLLYLVSGEKEIIQNDIFSYFTTSIKHMYFFLHVCSDRKDSLHRRELKWFGSQGRKEIYCSFNYIHVLYIPNYMNIKFRRFHVIRGSTRTVRVCNTGKPYLKPPLPPPLPPAMQKWKRKKEGRKETAPVWVLN